MARLVILLTLFMTMPLSAKGLVPFSAEYSIHVSRIPTPFRAELTLAPTGNHDEYKLDFFISSFLLKNHESSTFLWRDCDPRTYFYEHQFRGFGRRNNHTMAFSWDPPRVTTTSDTGRDQNEEHTYDIEADTLDDMTMLLRARCMIREGVTHYAVTSAYGDRLRSHILEITGTEVLETPLGALETIVLTKKRRENSKRHTTFWVAPALDYMMVKLRHTETSNLYGEIRMRAYSGPLRDDDTGTHLVNQP